MADNTDFTKKILIDVEVNSEQVKKDLPAILKEIENLADAQKVLEIQGQKNGKQWIENASQLRQLKGEVRDANKYIDNTAKALNAENNSIAQNRALLSLLTAEHIKLGQANGNSKAQIDASAKAINDLTVTLKDQEKAIGQTYRNVGNYEEAIKSALGTISQGVPGFQQFGAAVTVVGGFLEAMPKAVNAAGSAVAQFGGAIANTSKQLTNFVGFKQFGDQAKEAETAVEGVGKSLDTQAAASNASSGATEKAGGAFKIFNNILKTSIIGAIVAVVLLLINYLKTFDPLMDKLEQAFAGFNAVLNVVVSAIKNVFTGLTSVGDVIKGFGNFLAHPIDSMKQFGNAMAKAAVDAATLKKAQQDLEDTVRINEVKTAETQQRVAELILKARNKTLNTDQKKKYLDEAAKLDDEDFTRRTAQANEELRIATETIKQKGLLNDDQLKKVKSNGLTEILQLQGDTKVKGKITDAEIDMYKKAQLNIIAAKDESTKRQEKIQNKIDADADKAEQAAQRRADKADQLRQQKIDAENETENIRKSSAARQLQAIYEDYGDRVIAADASYSTEVLKLKKFLDKKLITQKEYNNVYAQLTKEHNGAVGKIIDDFNKEDAEKFRQSQNELRTLRIQGIENDTKRTIAGLKQKGIEQAQELDKQNRDAEDRVKALDVEISQLDGAAKAEAEERRINEISLIQNNGYKKIEIEKQTAKQIADVQRKAARDIQAAQDEASILKNKRNTNVFNNGGAQAAELQAISHRYDFEISEAQRAGKETVLLEQQKIDAINEINARYQTEKVETAVQYEQMAQAAVFDMLTQSEQARSQKALNELALRKDSELANISLTATQKKSVEAKFKKLEDAEKLRSFKANQKLQAANVLINGAVGVSKTIAEMGFIPALPVVGLLVASTALSIAKILSAKPGFASGGQFTSDGKGALLPGYSRKDNINSSLRSGEAVVVSEAMRNPWARNMVSDINVAFGGRSFATPGHQTAFATGGLFTDGGNANRYYSQPVYDQQGLANSMAYQLINNFPNVIVDVKDINNQQAIKAQTDNRVIL